MAPLSQINYSSSGNSFGRPGSRLTTLDGTSPGSTGTRSLSSALSPQSQAAAATIKPPTITAPTLPGGTTLSNLNLGAASTGETPTVPGISTNAAGKVTQPSPPAGSASGTPTLDSDPILKQIRDLATQNDRGAQNAAIAGKTQLLENYGDAGLANALGLGSNVAGVAAQNPNSILAQLLQGHNQNLDTVTRSDNKANLLYSSTHAHNLANEGQAYQTNRYNADQNIRQQIAQIDQTLAQALAGNDAQRIQGAQDAYTRYLGTNPTATETTPPPTDNTDHLGLTDLAGILASLARPSAPGAPASRLTRFAA